MLTALIRVTYGQEPAAGSLLEITGDLSLEGVTKFLLLGVFNDTDLEAAKRHLENQSHDGEGVREEAKFSLITGHMVNQSGQPVAAAQQYQAGMWFSVAEGAHMLRIFSRVLASTGPKQSAAQQIPQVPRGYGPPINHHLRHGNVY